MYIFENVNPKGKKTADCVVRAIAKAENRDWFSVYDELSLLARSKCTVLNDLSFYKSYLNKYETVQCVFEECGSKFKLTVSEFSNKYSSGIYLIQIAGHLTVCIDGNVYDIWNCLNKKVYKGWRVK